MLLPLAIILLNVATVGSGPRGLPDGSGPFLAPITAPSTTDAVASTARAAVRTETWVDIEASIFTPGKADPTEWMATGTWARVTYDGISHQYGYDPLTQTYDMMVSGYVDPQYGILAQETVGILAAPVPHAPLAGRVERVELRFHVNEHNLYPFENIGINAMTDAYTPQGDLNSLEARLLYEDARGLTGATYVLDHFDVGPHAIDLGSIAVADLETRLADGDDWFGVGFGADGWDLSQSWGQQVYWRVDGGGRLPEGVRPLLRIVYDAPPSAPTTIGPADGVTVATALPTLSWQPSTDPNGDAPVTYRVRIGTEPLLLSAIEFTAGEQTTARPPLALGAGTYYWAVEASDPQGATSSSIVQRFVVATGTDAPAVARALRLRAAPNPFNPRTVVAATLPYEGMWTLTVFDHQGRRVRGFLPRSLGVGEHRWTWNGHDDAGRDVASGVYEAILRDRNGNTARTRLTLVR